MSVCGFVHVIAVPMDTKNEWSLELELQAVVSYLISLLGTEFGSLSKGVLCALSH